MKSAAEPVGLAVLFGFVMLLAVFPETMVAANRAPIDVGVVLPLRRAFGVLATVMFSVEIVDKRLVRFVAVLIFRAIRRALLIVARGFRHVLLPNESSGTARLRTGYDERQTQGHDSEIDRFLRLLELQFVTKTSKLALAVVCATTIAAPRARAQHDMSHMTASGLTLPLGVPFSRVGSATSWLPDSSPMRAHHFVVGDWSLMLHGAATLQNDRQNGFRGDQQLGLIDWEMLMAAHPLAGGLFRVNAMTSVEAAVNGREGYPELVQTGGTFRGARLVNRQHPHNLVMEAAALYDHSLTRWLAGEVYVAAVGEPALGPVAYMHRPSADADPFAPIGHHGQDASHESFGVVTAALNTHAVKLEASTFNAREGDEYRYNLDYHGARLDSYSMRLTALPNGHIALSAWAGYLMAHDRLETPIGMQRYGASLSTSNTVGGRPLSTEVVWGLDIHHHGSREHMHGADATNLKFFHEMASALVEATLGLTKKTELTARLEQVQKSGDDLGFIGDDLAEIFTIRGMSLAVTRDAVTAGGFTFALGARGAVDRLPQTLRPTYHTVTPTGYSIFLKVH